MNHLLPSSSFVKFEAKKILFPSIFWANDKLPLSGNILDYAYCLPIEGEPNELYSSQSKTCYGERYGGVGVGSNGGGVRCGIYENVQIKGIGQNPLGGTTADFWHVYGGASLEESVREALWGEICNVALPYGAARLYGVIATGTYIPYIAPEGVRTAPRALLLREVALRPAHYMRSVFYSPSEDVRNAYPTDVERTKDSINQIEAGFRHALSGAPAQLPADGSINDYLMEMCRRFAVQIASGRVKKIMHGNLGPSNICIDGRWIDFGAISTVSDYGRIILGSDDSFDLWNQHNQLVEALNDLLFYLKKYLPKEKAESLITLQKLLQYFGGAMQERTYIEFLKLTGVPESRLALIDGNVLVRTYKCFMSLIAAGSREPFKLAPNHLWVMPEKMGNFHLNTILRKSASCVDAEDISNSILADLPDAPRRSEFSSCVSFIRKAYLSQFRDDVERKNAQTFMTLNAIRLNTQMPELYRPILDTNIAEIVHTGGDVKLFIDGILHKAKTILSDMKGRSINISYLLGSALHENVEFHETEGAVRNGVEAVSDQEIAEKLNALSI